MFTVAPKLRALTVILLAGSLGAGCGQPDEREALAAAQQMAERQEFSAAVVQLKSLLATNPDQSAARFQLGQVLMQMGDPRSAQLEFRKAKELRHPDALTVPAIADAMLATGPLDTLLEEFGKTVLDQPAAQAALKSTLAVALARQGKLAEAAQELVVATTAVPGFAPALLMQARLAIAVGKFSDADALVDQVLARDPKDASAWLLKGDLHVERLRGLDQAIEAYLKVISIDKRSVPAYSALIKAYIFKNDQAAADSSFAALRKAWPNHPHTRIAEARIALMKKNLPRARELLQVIVKGNSSDAQLLTLAGVVEARMDSLIAAEKLLTRAVSLEPEAGAARRALAEVYSRMGLPARAVEVLKPMLERKDADAGALALAAQAYMQQGDYARAEANYLRAAMAFPQDAELKTALALIQFAKGDPAAGLSQLERVSADDQGSVADLALISTLMQRGDSAQALQAVERLLKKQPSKPLGYDLRGRIQRKIGDDAAARASFEAALTHDRRYFQAASVLGAMDVEEGRPEAALKRFETMLGEDPKDTQVLFALADLAQRSGAPREQVRQYLDAARKAAPGESAPRIRLVDALLASRDFKQALDAAQETVASFPADPGALMALGQAQLMSGDARQAATSFAKAAALLPQSPAPWVRLAEVELANRNVPAALSNYVRALQINPRDPAAQKGMIDASSGSRQWRPARDLAKDLIKNRPKDAVGHEFAGDIEAAQKNWPAAAAAFRGGLDKLGGVTIAPKLHFSLVAAGQTGQAEAFVRDWRSRQPKDAVFVFYLGDTALSRNDFAAAQVLYLDVLKLQPKNVWALNNLAWLLAKQKKPGAEAYARQALAIAPNSSDLLDTLAFSLAQDGQFDKAIEVQKSAVQRAPAAGKYRVTLASIYLAQDKPALAREQIGLAVAADSRLATRSDVLEMRKQIGN